MQGECLSIHVEASLVDEFQIVIPVELVYGEREKDVQNRERERESEREEDGDGRPRKLLRFSLSSPILILS